VGRVERQYELLIDPSLSPCPVRPALVWAEGMGPHASRDEVPAYLLEVVERARAAGDGFIPPELRQRVRGMLRYGKYKPSGRGKPASEFLLRAALDGEMPVVNGPVDVNNAVSLASGLPGSIFDTALSGARLLLRRGTAGESYIFNPAGQSIDLEDLLLLCRETERGWEPCGNPVKDAMSTKIRPETRDVIAVLYAPAEEDSRVVETWAARYASMLSEHCRAASSGYRLVE
jgi:DNA/RNA-binding domain of Phe-tRNA-synthetase-like protein